MPKYDIMARVVEHRRLLVAAKTREQAVERAAKRLADAGHEVIGALHVVQRPEPENTET